MEESNQDQYSNSTPAAGPINQLKAQHLEDWRLLLDRLTSAEPAFPAEPIAACKVEISRLESDLNGGVVNG